jgi:site-specific DNA recombinase
MRNAVVYTRFSPRRNAETCESCEAQLAHCEQYAHSHQLEVKACYHDKDASGADEYREPLWQAIKDLRKGDVLLVYKRDRLARNVYLSEQINRSVAKRGGTIEAVSGDVAGTSAEHTMIRQVLASVAEYERKLISSRTKHSMKYYQSQGRRMGRYAPYGWMLDPADPSRMIVAPQEVAAIEEMRRLRREGKSLRSIVQHLDTTMPKASRIGHWSLSAVWSVWKKTEEVILPYQTSVQPERAAQPQTQQAAM